MKNLLQNVVKLHRQYSEIRYIYKPLNGIVKLFQNYGKQQCASRIRRSKTLLNNSKI